MNNSKLRKTSVVALLFLALALLLTAHQNQPQETTFSPTIDKITVDNETIFNPKTSPSNQITNMAILNRKASTITLFKNENKVIFHNTRLKDISKIYFKDIKTSTIEKHIDGGTIRDFVWLENAPSGGKVELPSTYSAIYRCTGSAQEPACEQLKSCSNTHQDTNCYFEKNKKTHILVDHFSGIFGASINILNVQSYPTVGGNWIVKFNTTGTANLTITASNNTAWSNENEENDMKFLEIKCGTQTLNYTWLNNSSYNSSIFIENYTCNTTAYEISRVLTTGKHVLKYTFGDISAYAQNWADNSSSAQQVDGCGTLSTANAVYTLNQSVNTSGTCFTIGADNITLDGTGYTINYSQSVKGYGINNSDGFDNITIKNLNIVQGSSSSYAYAIYGHEMENSTIDNNTITTSGSYSYAVCLNSSSILNNITNNTVTTSGSFGFGIYLISSASNTIANNIITNPGDGGHALYAISSPYSNISYNNFTTSGFLAHGVFIDQTNNSIFLSNSITSTGAGYALYLDTSDSNKIYDTFIDSHTMSDIRIQGTGNNKNYLINCTFNQSEVGFEASPTDKIEVQWYLDVYVNDSGGSSIEDANVTGWQNNGTEAFTNLTDAQGNTERQILTEYIHNATDKYYTDYVNYTVNANMSGYNNATQEINLTTSKQIYLTLSDITPPTINIVSPQNNSDWTTSSNVTFIYNTTANDIANCSLIINNKVYQTNTSAILADTDYNFSNIVRNAEHNWTITCTDLSGNTNTSDTHTFTMDYSTDYSYYKVWEITTPDSLYSSKFFDSDQDGNATDIIVGGNGDIFAYYPNGTQIWASTAPSSYIYDIEVFDIGNGYNDTIAIADRDYGLRIFNRTGGQICDSGDIEVSDSTYSIAVGDLDGDGNNREFALGIRNLSDDYTTVAYDSTCTKLWESPAMTGYVHEVETGDFDGDGFKDDVATVATTSLIGYLYVFNDSGDIFWNTGELGYLAYSIGIGDLNNDNIDDIIVSKYENILAFYGNGTNPWNATLDIISYEVQFADFDYDGKANEIAVFDAIYDNNGNIIWSFGLESSSGNYMYSLAITDIDNDQRSELISGSHIVHAIGNGELKWNFTDATSAIGSTIGDGAIIAKDIDNNGFMDIILASQDNKIYRIEATPTPTYQITRYIYDITDCITLACNQTGGILNATLTEEGIANLTTSRIYRIDVAANQTKASSIGEILRPTDIIDHENISFTEDSNNIFDSNSSGVVDEHTADSGIWYTHKLWEIWTTNDFDGLYSTDHGDFDHDDHEDDIVFGAHGAIYLYYDNNTLIHKATEPYNSVNDIEVFDIGNGYNDTIAIADCAYGLRIFDRTGVQICDSGDIEVIYSTVSIAVGDFDGDGNNREFALGIQNQSDDYTIVAYNSSCTKLWESPTMTSRVYDVETGDFDGDGFKDDVATIDSNGYLYVFNDSGDLLWNTSDLGTLTYSLEVSDLDGNDVDDILVNVRADSSNHMIQAWNGSGTNIWNNTGPTTTVYETRFGDFNNDGLKNDIVVPTVNELLVINASGAEIWNTAISAGIIYSLAVGDINNDGLHDIVIGGSDDNVHVYNYSGEFLWNFTDSDHQIGSIWGDGGIEITDINNDNINDIIVASYNKGYALTNSVRATELLEWNPAQSPYGQNYAAMSSMDQGESANFSYIMDISSITTQTVVDLNFSFIGRDSTLYSLNNRINITFVDSPPSVTINTPTNTTYTTTTITFNVTAQDNIEIDTCLYTLDNGVTNHTMSNSAQNEWNATNSTMAQGSHTVVFYCNDTSNNLNNTETASFFIDSIAPTINIVSPQNNSDWTTSSNVTFTYNTTASDIANCSLVINNKVYQTNTSAILADTDYNFSNIVRNAEHNWTITCTDLSGNTNTSDTHIFTMDYSTDYSYYKVWEITTPDSLYSAKFFDSDQDGNATDIIVGGDGDIFAYYPNGTQIWTSSTPYRVYDLEVFDIGNGYNDTIAITDLSYGLRIFDRTGSHICSSGYIADHYVHSIAVGDLDRDGNNREFALGIRNQSNDYTIVAYNSSCNKLWESPAITNYVHEVETGDFDGDGFKDDVATADYNGYLYVFNDSGDLVWNTGDLGSGTYSIGIGDLNNDNIDDIVVSENGNILAFYGNGTNPWNATLEYHIYEVQFADIDHDGKANEIAVVDSKAFHAFDNNGNIIWSNNLYESISTYAMSSLAIADIDNDQRIDLIGGSKYIYGSHIVNAIGNGELKWNFTDATSQIGTSYGDSAIIAKDIDNNDLMDIIIASQDSKIYRIEATPTPAYQITRYIYDITDCTTLACNQTGGILNATFTEDGIANLTSSRIYRIDIAANQTKANSIGEILTPADIIDHENISFTEDSNNIFDSNSSGVVDEHTADSGIWYTHKLWETGVLESTYSTGYGDFDHDGHEDDIVFGTYGEIHLYYDNGTLIHEATEPTHYVYDMEVFDIGNGYNDTIAIADDSHGLMIFDRTGVLICHSGDIGSSAYSITVGDFDSDGNNREFALGIRNLSNDFTIVAYNSSCNKLWESPTMTGTVLEVEAGDFDGDGFKDEVATVEFNGYLYVFNDTGYLVWNTSDLGVSYSLEVSDLNGNNVDDIVIGVRDQSSNFMIQAWNGSGTNIWNNTGPTNTVYEMRFGDFNNDGLKNDIVVPDYNKLWVIDASGAEIWNKTIPTGSQYSLAVGDINNDGLHDIVIGGSSNNVHVYNYSGEFLWNFTDPNKEIGIIFGDGGIEITDVNNDNINDIIVASYNKGYVLTNSIRASKLLEWNPAQSPYGQDYSAMSSMTQGENANFSYIMDISSITTQTIVDLNFSFLGRDSTLYSLNNQINITVDDTPPSVTINTPTSGWYDSNFTVNATVTDAGKISYVHYRWENSSQNSPWAAMSNDAGDFWNASFDITSVGDGNYTFRINAADITGNSNTSVTITDILIDLTNPDINFTTPPTPINDTTTTNTSIEINVSITEANLDEVKFNWNRTNYTLFNDSLVLMMNFDNVSLLGENDTHIVDVSGNGNDGTIINAGITWNSLGKYSGAFEFDSSDNDGRIEIPYSTDFEFDNSTGFSMFLWFKKDTLCEGYGDGNNEVMVTFFGDDNADDTWWFGCDANSGTNHQNELTFDFYPGDGSSHGLESNVQINDSTWHYGGWVYDDSTGNISLYMDGKLKDSEYITGFPGTFDSGTSHSICIGAYGSASCTKYEYGGGKLDEVRFWNRSLSASEIRQLYFTNLNKYDTDKWALYVNQSKNSTDGLDDGVYTYLAFTKDIAGNQNQTEERTVTIDATKPGIILNYPDNGANLPSSNINFNWTATDNLDDSLLCNLTIDGSVNQSNIASISGQYTNHTISGFNDGTYNWNIICWDNASNLNTSLTRSFTVDTTYPQIYFTEPPTPENDTTTTNTSIEINISITEANLDEVKFNWNGTNYTIFNDSLILMMNFDNVSALGENDTYVVDVSGNGNNGTWANSTTGDINYTTGKHNLGIEFDGYDDYIDIGNTLNISNRDFTMAMWINPREDLNDMDNWTHRRALMTKRGTVSPSEWSWFITGASNDSIQVEIRNEASEMDWVRSQGLEWEPNAWYHVSITYDYTSKNLSIYRNGIDVGGKTMTRDLYHGTKPVWIGEFKVSTYDWNWNGTIDEVRIYDRSLSASEIQQLYFTNLNKYDTDKWVLYVNQEYREPLGSATYTYSAYAKDTAGNENSTETRTLNVNAIIPQINFTEPPTPTNDTTTTNTSIEINISITEANLDEVKFNWNGTNYTIFNDSLILMMNFDNVSALGECTIRDNADCVVDLSGNNNDGTLGNAITGTDPTWTSSGRYNGGFEFDGLKDFIKIDHSDEFVIGDGTIGIWFKAKDPVYQTMISKDSSEQDTGGHVGISMNTEHLSIRIQNTTSSVTITSLPDTIQVNIWHYAAITFGSQGLKLYLDGVLVNQSSYTGSLEGNYEPIAIGANTDSSGDLTIYPLRDFFNGTIDEARIYNRSLSASEIQQLYFTNLNKYDTDKWNLYVNQSKNSTDGLDDGVYTYLAFAKDIAGNKNQTEERTITIDTTPPTDLTLITPENNTNTTDNTPNLNWTTVTEQNFANYTIEVDNDPSFATPDYTYSTTSITESNYSISSGWSEAKWYWRIIAYDTAGNNNISAYLAYTIDTTPPQFSTPTDIKPDITYTKDNLTCNFTAHDNNNGLKANITWYNNSVHISSLDELEVILTNNTNYNARITHSGNTSKHETWSCNVTIYDIAGNSVNSSDATTIQDTPPTAPATIDIAPTGAVYTNTTITCTAAGSADEDNDQIDYHYKFNKTGITLQDWSALDTYNCNDPGCDKGDTIYCFAKAVTDDANSTHISDSETVLNSNPQITLIEPINEDYKRDTFNFTYNVADEDNIADVDYCELWKNNGTGWTLAYNETTPQGTNNMTYGVGPQERIEDIEWYVNCTDISLAETKSTNHKVYIDNVNPVPHFYYPKADNSTVQPDWNNTFNLDVRAENDHLTEVNLTIANSTGYVVHSNLSGQISDTETEIEWHNLTYPIDIAAWLPGNYTITLNASDYAGNDGSWTRTFRINNQPTMTDISITQTVVANSQEVNITTQSADDADSDQYILRCGSASGLEDLCNSTLTTAGTEATCGFTNTWSDTTEHTIYCILDDTYDNSTESTDSIYSDNTAPQFTDMGVNDTDIKVNDSIMFHALWSDPGTAILDNYTFSWNDSGIWINTTANLIDWSNITRSIFSTQGKDIAWIIYANDSVGNTNSTGIQLFTVNNTLSNITPAQFNTTIFYIGDDIKCNSTITDADLDTLTITYDIWDIHHSENAPNYNETTNGLAAKTGDTYTATITNTIGAKGMWTCRFHVYDTVLTRHSDTDTATVPNTAPTTPTTLNPQTGIYGCDNHTISINCTGSTDPNPEDTISYNIQENSTGIWQNLNISDPDGLYDWDISAYPSTTGVDIRCNATDSYDESSYFNPTGTIIIDNTKPTFSNNIRNPDPPNEDQHIQVNITVTEIRPHTIILEWDTTTNYTVTTNNTDEYYFTILSGNYTAHDTITYKWYANDTLNNNNLSTQQQFTVLNQNPTIMVTEPDGTGDTTTDNYTVEWTASDLDNEDTLLISCYADADNTGLDETYICFQNSANDGTEICEMNAWTSDTYYIWCNATDGYSYTTNYSTGEVLVDNTDPAISGETNTTIPNEDETIQVNATITDTQSTIDTVWITVTINNTLFHNYTVSDNNGDEYYITLTEDNYTAHDNVTWQYFANDTLGNLGNGTVQEFTVRNQLPTLNPVPHVNNTTPQTNDIINCTGEAFSDNDNEDSEQSREYRWYNNSEIISGQEQATLDLSTPGLHKESIIECSIRVNDGYEWSQWHNSSDTATIQNTPPTAPDSIDLDPAGEVYTNTTITCNLGSYSDDDSDAMTPYYKFNDTIGTLQEWSTTDTYDCNEAGCDKGDTVYCWAKIVTDDANSTLVSDSETVLNSNPQITLLEPEDYGYRRDTFNFTYNATDEDEIADVDYCELWKNNGTGWTLLYNETTPQATNNVTYSVGPDNHIEDIEWYVNCTDMSLAETKSTNHKVYIDNVNPVPHFYYPKADNSTVHPDHNNTLNLDVRAENDHLIEVNLTITNSTGYVVHSNLSGTISDAETHIEWYNLTYPINIAAWLPDNYTITLNASDYAGNDGSWTRTFRINNPPAMTDVSITQSVVADSQEVNITTQGADDNDNDPYILRCGTASGLEDLCNSTLTTAGTEATCGFINTWSDTTEHTIYCILDDTYDNSTESTDSIYSDNTAPQFTDMGINDTDIKVNDSVKFYALWSDPGTAVLDNYIFSWNDSGIWLNTTANLIDWSNITRSIFSTQGKDIAWIIYANDSVGNTNSTGIQLFTVNNTLSNITAAQFNTSIFYIGDDIQCNSTITDADLDTLTITYDIWDIHHSENAPNYNEATNGQAAKTGDTYTATITNTIGAKGTWTCRFHVHDTVLTRHSDTDTATVPNTAPTTPTTLTPQTGTYGGDNHTISINCTGSTDPNPEDTVSYNIQENSTGIWQNLNISDPDGLYDWDISAYPSTTGVDIRCNATDSYDESNYYNPPGTITIDNTKPTITHTSPKNNTYLNYPPSLTGTCTDNTAIDTIWTNSSIYTTKTTTSPYSFQNTTTLANNQHQITIQCNDTINNTAKTSIYFTYDNIHPKIQFTHPTEQDSTTIDKNYTYINWTITETNWNTTIINWNSTNSTTTLSHINKTNLNDGTYTYYIWTNDTATNTNQTETRTITIDTTPPTVTLIYPKDNTWYNTSTLNLTFHTNDNIDTLIECNKTLDNINEHLGYIPKNTQNTTTMTSLTELYHNVNITCQDNANNTQTSETILFKIDTIPPTTTDNATGNWKPNNQTILLSCADASSGCNTTIYCIDDETNDCTPDTIGNTPRFTCPQGQVCKGYIRYWSNDTAGNHETTKNTTLIRIDTILPTITNCTATPALIDNDTKTSTTIEISCIINTTGSPIKSVHMTTDQPYETHINTTQMNTTLCTTPESLKYCAFFHPNTSTTLGKLYFHINATNELNKSNYQQNTTTSEINDLTIIYNPTTIQTTYYSFQTINPQTYIYFAENNSAANNANVTFHLKNTTSILNTSQTKATNSQANTTFYLGCANETQTMHINTSAAYSVLNEYNLSRQFNHSPITTTADCWFDQIAGKIDIYCSYNNTISNTYIQDALLLLNISLSGTCDIQNTVMDYNPSTQIYNHTCTPSTGLTYCSIPLNVTAQKACYEQATHSKDAATTIGFEIDAYFIPDNMHTMEHTTLWINTTSTDSDANGVNISITQTGGSTTYGPWNIIEDHYSLGYLTKDISHITTSDISVPSREKTDNYSVDITVSWNNTNCAGTKTTHPQLKILDSYYVDFTNIALTKNKFKPKDTLHINGTLENIGNVPVTGNLSAAIINPAGHTKGTLTCNASEITIPFNTGKDFNCEWTVTGPKRGITTGAYKVRLKYDSPQVSLLHEEDIYITVSEDPPQNKNVYITRYPITVIDRYGQTSQRIIKIYTWME